MNSFHLKSFNRWSAMLHKQYGCGKSNEKTNPGHESIGSSSFFVFEDDVRIVVWNEILESWVMSSNLAFFESWSRDGVFTDIGNMLH